jgi:DNA-binding NtrC family response regulator
MAEGCGDVSQASTEGARPTVLVVDDEEDLREAMTRMLTRRGFTALAADGPGGAADVCREYDGAIDLLLTDLSMPGTSGEEVARVATELRPEVRVVYVSGLPKDVAVDKGLVPEDAHLLQKPFTTDMLVAVVRDALSLSA